MGVAKRMINWQQVILNLNNAGLSCERIAKTVSSNQRHIARIARCEVKEPKFNTGVRILDLHYDHCFERHQDVYEA